MENNNKKSAFLESIKNDTMRTVLDSRITQLEKQEKKTQKKKELAEITKELMDSEYVDVGGVSLTIGDMMVATATANMINNPRIGFKEINDAQKVIEGNTNNMNGVTIVVNTNGQDLGDEI